MKPTLASNNVSLASEQRPSSSSLKPSTAPLKVDSRNPFDAQASSVKNLNPFDIPNTNTSSTNPFEVQNSSGNPFETLPSSMNPFEDHTSRASSFETHTSNPFEAPHSTFKNISVTAFDNPFDDSSLGAKNLSAVKPSDASSFAYATVALSSSNHFPSIDAVVPLPDIGSAGTAVVKKPIMTGTAPEPHTVGNVCASISELQIGHFSF